MEYNILESLNVNIFVAGGMHYLSATKALIKTLLNFSAFSKHLFLIVAVFVIVINQISLAMLPWSQKKPKFV